MSNWGQGQFAVVAAFRYCLGRKTYVVQECADWLVDIWNDLDVGVQSLIQKELEQAFWHDDYGPNGPPHLGMEYDRKEWERVRALWLNKD